MGVTIWMVFEALGPEKDDVITSIEDHVETMKGEKGIEVTSIEKDEAAEMEDPHPGLEKGYSQVVEIQAEFKSFQKAIETVINYGPTYIQMEGPDNYDMNLREAQETLQNVATTMHQYAQMGVGGVLISNPADDNS